jgi:GH25 family lysozyme M1 (1,4-beta-N-acetylmuramidase)
MKVDSYTKSVLTMIAVCLSLITIKQYELVPSLYANSAEVKPMYDASEYRLVPVNDVNTIDVRIVDISTYDELNVNLKGVDTYDEVKVNIKSIDTSDELDVNIDEVGGSWLTSGSSVPVTIKQ